jgi:hypothetical protein
MKFQQFKNDVWEALLKRTFSFSEEHGISKLGMEEEYIDRHGPMKKTNHSNYKHYRYDCLNPHIDLLLAEFNDCFNKVNSYLLLMDAFGPTD